MQTLQKPKHANKHYSDCGPAFTVLHLLSARNNNQDVTIAILKPTLPTSKLTHNVLLVFEFVFVGR
jgi:hypothetical protein